MTLSLKIINVTIAIWSHTYGVTIAHICTSVWRSLQFSPMDSKNAQLELAVNKPKPYRLKPKPQKLPQNRTAKITAKPYRKTVPQKFAVLLSVLA